MKFLPDSVYQVLKWLVVIVIPAAAGLPQALHSGVQPVVLDPVSEQRVHGDLEKVRHLHDEPKFGQG